MEQKRIKTTIIPRNGSAAEWAEANPVLLKGEIGLENDTRLLKIGDGLTAWNELPYATAEAPANTYIANVKETPDKKLILEVEGLGTDNTSGLALYLYVSGPSRHRKGDTYYTRRGWRHPEHGDIMTSDKHWVLSTKTRQTEIDIDKDQITVNPATGVATIQINSNLRSFIIGFARRSIESTGIKVIYNATCLRIGRSIFGIPDSSKDTYNVLRGRFGFALHEQASKKRITPIYPIDISVALYSKTQGGIHYIKDLYTRIL